MIEVGLVFAGAIVFTCGVSIGILVTIRCVKLYLKINGYCINEMMQLVKPMTDEERSRLFSYLEKYEAPIKKSK